ncbi:MAG: GNAT family N-acetyltransferase [Brevinematia bacterium]
MFEKVYITEAKSSDYDEIVKISKDLFLLSPYRVDIKVLEIVGQDRIHEIVYSILENSTATFILVSGSTLIAFLSWSFEKNISRVISRNYYRINLFGVRKEFQNKGFGKTLLDYFLNYIRRHRADIIEVNTDANNQSAFRIYSSFGFNYSSSFLTFRLFKKKKDLQVYQFGDNDDFALIKKVENVNEISDFANLRIKNERYDLYPVNLFYDRTIEDSQKRRLFDFILKSVEEKMNLLDIFVGYVSNKPVGYGVIREDFSLSNTLSKVSSRKDICVYKVLDLFVDEEYRGMGFGKAILSVMISGVSKDYDFVEVVIPSHNYAMSSVLTSLGFKLSHTMINFVKNSW